MTRAAMDAPRERDGMQFLSSYINALHGHIREDIFIRMDLDYVTEINESKLRFCEFCRVSRDIHPDTCGIELTIRYPRLVRRGRFKRARQG